MNDGFFNPPKLDEVNNNPLIAAAMKNKNSIIRMNDNINLLNMIGKINSNNFAQFGMRVNPAQRNLFLNNSQQFNNFNNNNQPFQQILISNRWIICPLMVMLLQAIQEIWE